MFEPDFRPKFFAAVWAAIVCGVALPLASCGQNGGPRRFTVTPQIVDFGRVRRGEVRHATLRFENGGSEDVVFQASVSCPCFTLVGIERSLLGPGERLDVQLRFDSGSEPAGPLPQKTLAVHTNEAGAEKIEVPLRADILRTYDVTGASIHVGSVVGNAAEAEPRIVEIRPATGWGVELIQTRSLSTHNTLAVDVPARLPTEPLRIAISISPAAVHPRGPLQARLKLNLRVISPEGEVGETSEIVAVTGFWGRETPPEAPPTTPPEKAR